MRNRGRGNIVIVRSVSMYPERYLSISGLKVFAEKMYRALTLCTQYGTLIAEVENMMKNISVRKLRTNLANVLNGVKEHMDSYVISKHGEPEAILMCVDDYEGWLETVEILSDKKAMDDIKQAKRELAMGKSYSFEKVFDKSNKTASK